MSKRRQRIVIIDDEPKMVRLVKANLESAGYSVLSAETYEDGLKTIESSDPDLVILDVMLPDGDGYELCEAVREFSTVPIIMLTAKAREADVLRGFSCGADDYIAKPFSSPELLARVQAVLRRASRQAALAEEPDFKVGDLVISFSRRRVFRGQDEIKLSSIEYNLLSLLAKNAGRVLLHHEILTKVWGPEYRDEVGYLRAYVRNLRRKIEADPSSPKILLSSTGIGYYVVSPDEIPGP